MEQGDKLQQRREQTKVNTEEQKRIIHQKRQAVQADQSGQSKQSGRAEQPGQSRHIIQDNKRQPDMVVPGRIKNLNKGAGNKGKVYQVDNTSHTVPGKLKSLRTSTGTTKPPNSSSQYNKYYKNSAHHIQSRQERVSKEADEKRKEISIDDVNNRGYTFSNEKPVKLNDGFKRERFRALIVIYLASLGIVLGCIGMEAARFKTSTIKDNYSTAEANKLNVGLKGGMYAGIVNNLLKTSWYLDGRLVGYKSSNYTYSIQGAGKHTLTMVRGSKAISKDIVVYRDTNTEDETGRFLSMCGSHTSEYAYHKDSDNDGIPDIVEDKTGLQKFNTSSKDGLMDITILMNKKKLSKQGEDGIINIVRKCSGAEIDVTGYGNIAYTFIDKSTYNDELQGTGYVVSDTYKVFSDGNWNGIGDSSLSGIVSIELSIDYDDTKINKKDISIYRYDEDSNSISIMPTEFNRNKAITNLSTQGIYFIGRVGYVPIQRNIDIVYLVENTYETVNNKYIEDRDKLLSGIQSILQKQSNIPNIRTGIATFQSEANIVTDINVGSDSEKLIEDLGNLRNICNTSSRVNWINSMYSIIQNMDSLPDSDSKYIILVTNELTKGERGEVSLRAIINRMKANNIKVIALGINKYNRQIREVAEGTGGYYLYTTSMSHVDDYTKAIASSINDIVYRSKRYKEDNGYKVIASSYLTGKRVLQFNSYHTNKYKYGNSDSIYKLVMDINSDRQGELRGKSIYAYTSTYTLSKSIQDINNISRENNSLFSKSKGSGYYLDVGSRLAGIKEKYGVHEAYMLSLMDNISVSTSITSTQDTQSQDLVYNIITRLKQGKLVALQLEGECGTHCVLVKNISKKTGSNGTYDIQVYDNFDYDGDNHIKIIEIPVYKQETNSIINGYAVDYEVKGIRFNSAYICQIR